MSSSAPADVTTDRGGASGLRAVGLSELPKVLAEWRRRGRPLQGFNYFVYDIDDPSDITTGGTVYGRQTALSYGRAFVERPDAHGAVRCSHGLAVGAQLLQSEQLFGLLRPLLDVASWAGLRLCLAVPAPSGALRMVTLGQKGLEIDFVPLPRAAKQSAPSSA